MLLAPGATPGEKSIGASIRIGREIRCFPYAGFIYTTLLLIQNHWNGSHAYTVRPRNLNICHIVPPLKKTQFLIAWMVQKWWQYKVSGLRRGSFHREFELAEGESVIDEANPFSW